MLICLLGCSSIDYGTVINKSYNPAHTLYQPMIMVINKQTRIIPRWVSYSDSWKILVENDQGKEWWDVTEEYFNDVNIGDEVDRRKENK